MAAVPQPQEAGPDIAGLAESLFHEITSVCDTMPQAGAVLRKLDSELMSYYFPRKRKTGQG